MLKPFLLVLACMTIINSNYALADSSVMHQQIDYMRQECIDRGGSFEYPTCHLPEEEASNVTDDDDESTSSSGSSAAAAGLAIVGAACLWSYLANKGPCASGN